MLSLNRARLALGLAVLATAFLALSPSASQAQKKKPASKPVKIPTFDGVTLGGTLYANPSGKRDAVVVFLHHFDAKKGGSSADGGWADLAAELVDDGYSVLSFDFRGFGESKEVDDKKFWGYRHNSMYVGKKKGAADQISYSQFKSASYYPYLVNDIAAVKAFLDRRNDARELNSGNIILIGAGDGAALGALWLAHAARLRRDKAGGVGLPTLGEPEVKDVAAAIWLSMTSKIGTKGVSKSLDNWCFEVGKQNKVPMAWLYGKKDAAADALSKSLLTAVKGPGGKAKDLEHTGRQAVDTKLAGSGLLDRDLGTIKFIVSQYLPKVMEDRGSRPRDDRDAVKSPYWYTAKGMAKPFKLNKKAGEDVGPVDLGLFLSGF